MVRNAKYRPIYIYKGPYDIIGRFSEIVTITREDVFFSDREAVSHLARPKRNACSLVCCIEIELLYFMLERKLFQNKSNATLSSTL